MVSASTPGRLHKVSTLGKKHDEPGENKDTDQRRPTTLNQVSMKLVTEIASIFDNDL